MSMDVPDREQEDLLAAELAFGLLDGEDLARAQGLLKQPSFARAVARWEDHAATWLDAGEVAAPPGSWSSIEHRLPANTGSGRSVLNIWRAAAVVSTAAAAVLAVVVAERPAPKPPVIVSRPLQPPVLAILTSKTTRDVVSISYDRTSRRITTASTGLAIGSRSPELWVIPADGVPRALGLIASSEAGYLNVAEASQYIAPGATLAVSLEPTGGSPTGNPTGPIIVTGKIVVS